MRRTIVLLMLTLTLTPIGIAIAADDEPGFAAIFDGKTLDGWKKTGGGATYRVADGCIVGEVGPGANTFLKSEKTYGDFVLKLDVKLEVAGNSGIQIRGHQAASKDGNGRVFGYQCEIDPSPRAWTGGLYDESRRGWLYPLTGHPEAQKAFRIADWNQFTIEAKGPRIRTWVNDVPCADVLDTLDLDGFLALQVHAGKTGKILWKNLRLKDLGTSHWSPIWDGESLAGWTPTGGGKWTIENHAIHGLSASSEPKHGHLVAEGMYGDFAIRLKFKAAKGNSGLYFRTEEGGSLGIRGFQAEIDADHDVGGLYETEGRGWVVQPTAKDVATWFRPGQWNEMAVIAIGDRVVVLVNGKKSAEIDDPQGRKSGKVALQLHGGMEMDVQFKDLEVLKIGPRA